MDKMVRARLIIKGRVQGVYFRAETQSVLEPLGIRGWVRNRADRTVEALLEGTEDNVRKAIDWCRQGPPSAHVTDMEISWETYSGEFAEFRIVR